MKRVIATRWMFSDIDDYKAYLKDPSSSRATVTRFVCGDRFPYPEEDEHIDPNIPVIITSYHSVDEEEDDE